VTHEIITLTLTLLAEDRYRAREALYEEGFPMSRIPSYRFLEKPFEQEDLERFTNEDGLWYESPEEIERGLDRGKKRAARLMLLAKLIEERLTPPQRTCTRLYYFEGKSLREIGAILDIHFTTVHQHIQASMKKLKRAVAEVIRTDSSGVW
jgi:RNA polymerase sigma factor (sigma-70 family)